LTKFVLFNLVYEGSSVAVKAVRQQDMNDDALDDFAKEAQLMWTMPPHRCDLIAYKIAKKTKTKTKNKTPNYY